MISVEEAFETIIRDTPEPSSEIVALENCPLRVLAEDIRSDIPMPPFDRSAMDGFALRGACESYELLPEITAGSNPQPIWKEGTAAPIMTGAPVPQGADRVVMVEHAEVSSGRLTLRKMPEPGENICLKAEDIKEGQTVLQKGSLITPAEIGIAAMAGRSSLRVFRKPSVSIVTTGSEVIDPEGVPGLGQVRNANGPLMEAFLKMNGFPPAAVLHSPDDPDSLRNTIVQAAQISDFVLTAGGVSMGTRDFVPSVFSSLGYDFRFRSVAQKPGKPLSFAVGEKLAFGLPGNPVSVLVSLEMYVLPALRYASGHCRYRRKQLTGILKTGQVKKPGRQCFYRCRVFLSEGRWMLSVPETSGSGDLMSAGGTNSIAWLPPESPGAEAGEAVPFTLMSWAGGESSWE